MKMLCTKCGEDGLDPHGKPSWLDGLRGHQCCSCKHVMAPCRSRRKLAKFLALSVVIELAGCGGIILFLVRSLNGATIGSLYSDNRWSDLYYSVLAFVVGTLSFVAILRALMSDMPKVVE